MLAKTWLRRHEEVHEPSRRIDPLVNGRRGAAEVAADNEGSVEPIRVLDAEDGQPGTPIRLVSDVVDERRPQEGTRRSNPADEFGHPIRAATRYVGISRTPVPATSHLATMPWPERSTASQGQSRPILCAGCVVAAGEDIRKRQVDQVPPDAAVAPVISV